MDRFHANSFIEEGKIQPETKKEIRESKIENINCLHFPEEASQLKAHSNSTSIMEVEKNEGKTNVRMSEANKAIPSFSSSQPTSSTPEDSLLYDAYISKKHKKEEVSQEHEVRRKYRNAREKERSCFISQQIQDLQRLLSMGGFTSDSKESKSTILDKTANYIKLLQKDQHHSQIERQQIMSQLVDMSTKVSDLGMGQRLQSNHNELRDASIKSSFLQSMEELQKHSMMNDIEPFDKSNYYLEMMKIEEKDYRFIFESCSAGIAVSSLGGKIIDCNARFCEICNCTKEDLLGTTIFSLIDKSELQNAYDQLCTMISEAFWDKSTTNHDNHVTLEPKNPSCSFRGGSKVQNTALSIVLVKGEDGVPRLMCMTSVPGHHLP